MTQTGYFDPTLSRPRSPAPFVGTVIFEERAALGECLEDQAPSQSGSSGGRCILLDAGHPELIGGK